MGLVDLFLVASMPVIKVLLLTALGSFLALDRIGILGESARKQLNNVVFYVFSPAIVSSNLAKTVTAESVALLWFMPLNILITFMIGSALAWILLIITRPPQHLKGIVLGCCSAGNLGIFPLIIFPAVCKEKNSPFGDPDVCYTNAMSYASLSMAIGAIYIWSYVYNIVRILSTKTEVLDLTDSTTISVESTSETAKLLQGDDKYAFNVSSTESMISILDSIQQQIRKFNIKALLAPSTIGATAGFFIGIVSPLRKLLIGPTAPLRAIQDSVFLLGDAAIPTVTLIVGGNLLKGLKGSGVPVSLILGTIAIRYICLPIFGIVIVKGAIHFGIVHSDPLYQFALLLQFALPPAMNIGTITQLFGSGQSECSVILLWTYLVASVSLTMWSTLFMWLIA